MLSPDINLVIEIHEKVVGKNLLRGKEGIHLLDSAVNSAFQELGGIQIYPEPFDKAVRLLIGIIKNHPFVDGNKRTAFATAKELLKEYRMDLKGYKVEEMVEFLESIASSEDSLDKLFDYAKDFLKKFIFP